MYLKVTFSKQIQDKYGLVIYHLSVNRFMIYISQNSDLGGGLLAPQTAAIAPENRTSQQEKIAPQPLVFEGKFAAEYDMSNIPKKQHT